MKGEYMFYLFVGIQVAALLVGMACAYILFRFPARVESKFLFAIVVSVEIFGFGYLLELLSNNAESAMTAMIFEFMGLAYMTVMYSIFVLSCCRVHKIPKWIWTILFVFNSFVLAATVLYKQNDWMFREIRFSEEGLFPHLEYSAGWLYSIFLIEETLLILFNEVVLGWKLKKTIIPRERRRYGTMLIIGAIPILGVAFSGLMIVPEYDPLSALLLIMVCFYSVHITNGSMVDVVSIGVNQAIMNSSKAAIFTDLEGRFLSSNAAAHELFPQLVTWMIGRPISELEGKHINLDEGKKFEHRGRYFSVMKEPIVYLHRTIGYMVVLDDITESEQQVYRMAELKMAADEANTAKSRFLANMSHEMRTPLNAIIGMAELSQREKDPAKISEYVDQIKDSGKMLLDIVCDVLDFSKAESGKLEIAPVSYDLLELLNGVINVINMRIGEKGIDFIVRINPKTPRYLFGDDVRIRQVLLNFLGNAEKFTDSGYIKLSVDYFVRDGFPVIKMFIEDSGCGIKEEDLGKLFKEFSQVDYNFNRSKQGSGLGLAISAQIIELMNGKYHVTSEYGMGSLFSFEIPQKQVREGTLGSGELEDVIVLKKKFFSLFDYRKNKSGYRPDKKNSSETRGQDKYPGASVLVVDDNEINIKVMEAMLNLFDIKAVSCTSGAAAVGIIQKRAFDLILMDHMMPGMDGVEATTKIRELAVPWAGSIPIVACTANAIQGIDNIFVRSGMNGFIAKPVILEELAGILKKYISE